MNKERRAAENEQFTKVLMVAEKPSVAKMIAEHLSGGRFRTRRGQSRANQIFEFIKWFEPAKVNILNLALNIQVFVNTKYIYILRKRER